MADLDACFFDTSILIGGLIEIGTRDAPAQRILDAVAAARVKRPMTAWHCCLEFYSVSTRLPAELRLTAADAARLVEEEILARFRVYGLSAARRTSFLRGLVHDGVVGGRVYDAHIAEIARLAGADRVVTDNRRHFTPILRHGIRVLTGAELVDEAGL